METVDVIIRIPRSELEYAKKGYTKAKDDVVYRAIENGTILPENHGKIVDLSNIDKDKIEKDNPVMTINIDGTAIEAVSLDYLNNLPPILETKEVLDELSCSH